MYLTRDEPPSTGSGVPQRDVAPTYLGVIKLKKRLFNAYSDGTLVPVIAGGSEDATNTVLPRLLTDEQVGYELQLGRTRVWHLISTGQLRSVKIGRSRRVPREALDEFIAGLAGESPS